MTRFYVIARASMNMPFNKNRIIEPPQPLRIYALRAASAFCVVSKFEMYSHSLCIQG